MKITVLIDNQEHPENSALRAEHGLSFHIETERGEKVLLDVGASDKFLYNAEELGIDIADVNYLILSHAHNDHTGGLDAFLQHNGKARIFLSSHIRGEGYYSSRRGGLRDISIDYRLLKENEDRFAGVGESIRITPSVRIVSEIPAGHALPKANGTLLCGGAPDTFSHEMAVLLTCGKDTILLSSCTHLGLLNTLEACRPECPTVFIGGMHLVDSDDTHLFETETELLAAGRELLSAYPELQIYTGHCTGGNAQRILKSLMPKQFHTFYAGFEWIF